MFNYLGIIFSAVSLLSWGFGDFFIQKATRVIGTWKALFFIGVFGFLSLFPFVINDIANLSSANLLLLIVLGCVVIFTALFDFEALKVGKIAIIEPVIGLELPLTVGLSIGLGREDLTFLQMFLVLIVFIGIVLATLNRTAHNARKIFEKGVILAGVGAIGMALTNFIVGVSSQDISPLMTIWFAHSMLAIFCGFYLIYRGGMGTIITDLKSHPGLILGQSILDNVAWIAFALATTFIPISIATTISESYIALAVLLGIFVNKEKLRPRQVLGIALTVGGVIILSILSG